MARAKAPPRTVIGLLALLVLVQGALGVLPHDHDLPRTRAALCDNPCCPAPAGAHLAGVGPEHSGHECLACSIRPTVFWSTEAPLRWQEDGAVRTEAVPQRSRASLPRRWTLPLRGPPACA